MERVNTEWSVSAAHNTWTRAMQLDHLAPGWKQAKGGIFHTLRNNITAGFDSD